MPNRPVRVTSVEVEGVTAYPQPEIAQLAAGLVGPAVPLPQIDAARQAILQRYRADGYVLTTVSAQPRQQRQAALRRHRGPHRQRQARRRHRPGRRPRCCASSTGSPRSSRSIRSRWSATCCWHRTCRASACAPCWSLPPTQPGALNLIAQVSRQNISGLATIDNRAFNQTGPIEFLGLLDFNSFSQFGEKTEVSYYHAFPNSLNFGQASTEMFLGASGLKGKVYGGYGATVPTGTLGSRATTAPQRCSARR